MQAPVTDEQAREAAEALAAHGSQVKAAAALGIARSTLQNRLRGGAGGAAPKPAPQPATPAELVVADRKIVRLQDEVNDLRAKLREAQRGHLADEVVLDALGVMGAAPESPPDWLTRIPAASATKTPEVPVTIWSDWHMGEVVSRDEVGGCNAYNIEIAERRVRRLLDATIDICANHGPKSYPGIVVNLLGDFVSGGLHPELAKTDDEEVIPAALRCRDLLIAGLERMAAIFGKVYVPCTAGNHGRGTPKPEFKRYVYKNFDWLIYQLLQRHFADDPRVQIDIRASNEVHYRVYGQRYLAMHGDMLGVKGGDGIIGSIGPIMRGEVKTRGQATSLGNDYDILLMGHWHQELWLPRAIVANTLKGFDEYAKNALRAPPSEPSQPLWFVHPTRGITSRWAVKVEERKATPADWVSWREAA
ncbi:MULTISPECIES: hypothetical protein [unclassified Chelatococcus]|uniref:hypothetical protein n=2 Tax=Chelatococcus TaxID=28209 RepID=UPI001BD082CB|nr:MULTISPECIES: hypothetical protein [unclassified Chelatococcus]MBS7737809.1 hypothetical protein [Chelatococcus sp. HY11]MCO5079264.1 hypothetical protein [Chelatococcus sp.]CAH1666021.1 conserved hypothetical protein [Hyphomicrobiales bacterium]CAH1680948.1 conserved hypothetical protein [Hyphomicrobiales bacterium]